MEVEELFEMVTAHQEYQENNFDIDMQKLSWQTSIIINCMGTMKKKVKPKDLYDPNKTENDTPGTTKVSDEEMDNLKKELMETFNL